MVRQPGPRKGARASLVRRLERLAAGKPDLGDVNTIARALWHKRHPELLPVVRRSLQKLALPGLSSLGGLLVARKRVEAFSLHEGSLRAAVLLQYVGRPEDAELLLAHRPAEPILAKVFDDAVAALHKQGT
ncbi:hypothetical protein NR798_45190 [Archangium gephyra]|uniref:hypothetical protein n=1 Tax=Archangium gephyra TaxID=48 RepID=UPI0035D3F69A